MRAVEQVFDSEEIAVVSYGNVLAAASFLYGLATSELRRDELDYNDPDIPLLIGIKARKA